MQLLELENSLKEEQSASISLQGELERERNEKEKVEERACELEREGRRGEEEREELKRRWEATTSECLFQSKENESLRGRLEEMEEEFEEKDVSFEQISVQLEEGMKRERELRDRLKIEETLGRKLKKVAGEKERERQQIGNECVGLKRENADLEV